MKFLILFVVAMLLLFHSNLTPVTAILSLLCIVYGCRLGGYLMIRERKSASYQKTMKNDIKPTIWGEVLIWTGVFVSGIPEVCENYPHPAALYPPLQRCQIQMAVGLSRFRKGAW